MTTVEIASAVQPADPEQPAVPDAAEEEVAKAESVSGTAVADSRIAALEARLTEVADSIGVTGGKVRAIESAAAVAAGQISTVESKLVDSAQQQTAVSARLDAVDGSLATAGIDAAATSGRVDALTDRMTAADSRLAAVDAVAERLNGRAAEHDKALADVQRSIAAEVERQTSDALVESQHRLQLAVNSMAQLALAMAESSTDITEDLSAESAAALPESFKVDLDAILSQLGFEALDTTVGDTFDPHRHRALKRNPTSDPKQDKAITRVIRDGYRNAATDRILLFADVEGSRHRP